MPLQNRVTPFGEILATPERGTLVGNRGVLHGEQQNLVRTSQVRRWICCVLAYKGIRRVVMTPRRWTELFFLDEATAFAAGHRPCFECRRPAALAFQAAWRKAHVGAAMADDMGRRLSEERRLRGGQKRTHVAAARSLPEGTFVAFGGAAWLLLRGRALRWGPGGYGEAADVMAGDVDVLTPPATVAVIRAGYVPLVHPSAHATRG